MKIVVTGASGQVGWELSRSLSVLGQVVALGRDGADLTRPDSLVRMVDDQRPDVLINAAAYTAVDAAEADVAGANTVNSEAVGVMAEAMKRVGGLFVHYSTDYVFDGTKTAPYVESDPTCPVNVYGSSKLDGERAIAEAGGDWLTFRTTWVFAARGKNFLRTMLRLGAQREELSVVADQFGAPTWARSIADGTAQAVAVAMHERQAGTFESALYHMTSSGRTSWHGFAEAVFDAWRSAPGATSLAIKTVLPIPASAYPVPAQRPANSSLSNLALKTRFGVELPDWRYAVELCVKDLLPQ
ncbi:dTDP-4-dehydrorhamnose reductase [Burkholderia sp. 22PA0099]|uniref:dTDP-4-dehydrorhamnose reductase n=1 Tax=Burkholderia sp. 22PA0099 TaxID=3237372 RepID=UPI0039C03A90